MLARPLRHAAPTARCLGAALGLSLAFGLAVAAAAALAQASSSSGSTLRVEADTSFSTFNPFLAYFIGDLNVNRQYLSGPDHDQLLRFGAQSLITRMEKQLLALRDVSFEIKRGNVVGIIGRTR